MIEKYYTREQPHNLQPRERELGAWAIRRTESEWSRLIAMLELARRWQELIGEFTGEDAHPDGACADDLSRRLGAATTPNANKSSTRWPPFNYRLSATPTPFPIE